MDFTNFIQHLEQKEKKTRIEVLALQAVKDTDFMNEYSGINFAHHIQQFTNVVSNPTGYDVPDNDAHRAHYERALQEITTAYSSYLYDNKGKYSSLKGEIDALEGRINTANSNLEKIKETSELISGAEVLVTYAKEFKGRAVEFKEEAYKWQKKLYVGFLSLSVVVVFFFYANIIVSTEILQEYLSEEIVYYGYISIIAIKVIILIGIIQIIRFFYRNYNANKHLENQTLHKYDVLRALQGVYNTIDSENKTARDELIKTGALTAFQNTESGYITTKEGAGNTDAGLAAAISSFFRK